MREIVTLQLGHLGNYVATHFWNTQESYFTYSNDEEFVIAHDVHWRSGISPDGSETYLPRTVIYDLKGGFGALRKINALYDPEPGLDQGSAKPLSLWPGDSVVHKQEPVEISEYQRSLDAGSKLPRLTTSAVRYWSDFSRVFYHPRSSVQLYDFELNSTIQPFDRFEMGQELFSSLDKEHDIVDRDFRPFVEECDRMQGIQVLASVDDAWGGFSAAYLEALRDEYPKSCIWLWGLQKPPSRLDSRSKRQLSLTNTAKSVLEMYSSASMIVPLCLPEVPPPGLSMDLGSQWHTSAVFATAMETATLATRLKPHRQQVSASIWDLVAGLNIQGNQSLAGIQMHVGSSTNAFGCSDGNSELFSLGYTDPRQRSNLTYRTFGLVSSSRGAEPPGDSEGGKVVDPRDPGYQRFHTNLKYPILDSFPAVYGEHEKEEGIDVQTILSTDTSISRQIKSLDRLTSRSVSSGEREAMSNGLAEIGSAYENEYTSDSDAGDF